MQQYLCKVKVLPDYLLLLTFNNSEERILNMKEYLDKGVFQELRDYNLFRTVRVSFDALEWDNGADLDPDIIYEQSVPAASYSATPAHV